MDKNPRLKRKARLLRIIGLSGLIIGGIIGAVRAIQTSPGIPVLFNILKGLALGLIISLAVGMLKQFVLPEALKKFNFLFKIVIETSIYTAVFLSLFLLISLAFTFGIPFEMQLEMMLPTIIINFVILLVATFIIEVNRLLGRRVLMNFFTGKYYHPVEEERIFMFLDLTSSTTIAEKIGNIEFHKFLNDFFFDITSPIIESGGEIYKYVGDEVIAAWKVRDPAKNYGCIRSYFQMLAEMEINSDKYLKKYGLVPEFKTGMHSGRVITGEMGDYKREIAFLGDVVNTTARIQEECKVKKQGLLISKSLRDIIAFPDSVQAESRGAVKLRGKTEDVELFSIHTKVI